MQVAVPEVALCEEVGGVAEELEVHQEVEEALVVGDLAEAEVAAEEASVVEALAEAEEHQEVAGAEDSAGVVRSLLRSLALELWRLFCT